jgi:acyl-CoA dehydrogenase
MSEATSEDGGPELRARIERFVLDVAIPAERQLRGSLHDAADGFRVELQDEARRAEVFGPTVPVALGGLGLDRRDQAWALEAAGYSLFGPLAMGCAAPDEGNLHLLDVVADPGQRERYLQSLAAGAVRSCFAMTEPSPGAGSDPRLLRTTATRTADGWRIDGRKWFTTGAVGAAFAIVMARTEGEPGQRGSATMFLVDADNPGMRIERTIGTLDESMMGGHAEIAFDDCRVGPSAVLGEVDRGFEYAQVRLAPARLTHCMRWLGIARRSLDIAVEYASERTSFGQRLVDNGLVQQMVADSVIDLSASRALVVDAAAELDAGGSAAQSSSIAKTFVSEAVGRVVDRAVQMCGASAISEDLPLGRFYREVRPFRIYDGPSEVHRGAIARREVAQVLERLADRRRP